MATDAPPPVWVSEAAVDLYGFAPGRVIELPLAGKVERFTVAGVWRDYGRQQGVIAMERSRYIALTGDRTVTTGALWLADGVDRSAFEASVRGSIPGGERLEIARPEEIREASLKVFDRTFAVTYALELAAVVIGLAGLSSSFGALVLARRREFGVLRHLGMTRRQIGAMLATEGLAVSAIGLGVGCGARLRDQPHSHSRGQPAVVSLGHGTVAAVGGARRVRAAAARAVDADGARQRTLRAGQGCRARREGRLVSAPRRRRSDR